MKLTQIATENILRQLFDGGDYRAEILALIDTIFLQHAIDFFRQIIDIKLSGEELTGDWYKKQFLDPNLDKAEIGINAGLNMKSITNTYGTSRKVVVVEASLEHYDELREITQKLIDGGEDIDLTLTIKFKSVSLELNLSETLIVINSLAVKRAQIRGGAWSTAGKQAEMPFMVALSKLYSVPRMHYDMKGLTDENREVDFHFIDDHGKKYRVEFKLMGKGNPESADAAIARQTDVFVADTLSDTNKAQFDGKGIHWIELRSQTGFRKLYTVLQQIGIPCKEFQGDLHPNLDTVIPQAFDEIAT